MGRKSFDIFGALAGTKLSETEQAGRYSTQKKDEMRVAPDVARKLDLRKTDTLLDVGCGPGIVARRLAPRVKRIVVLDHPNTIKHLRPKVRKLNFGFVAGEFMEAKFNRRFDKVLIYSVLHYLSTPDDAIAFVSKAADLLKPGGRMLVGELANRDLKARFVDSKAGKRFNRQWRKNTGRAVSIDDPEHFAIDDAFVLHLQRHFREKGFHAWLLPEDPDLPFGRTREDLLVVRP
jgi:2-polyprenyl-3-methyl-5-hydroxy-6-metoxy-1,4-benzoquinol methylase